jgi:hypothetical protein
MSGVGGFRMQRIVNDGTDRAIGEAERSAGSRSILFDPGKSEAMESIPPKSTGIALSAQLEGVNRIIAAWNSRDTYAAAARI